jgi:SAM-dependent methyltransferase
MSNSPFDENFYSQLGDRSLESARIVAPFIIRLAAIRSVIDVGCGLGGWLRAFSENGVPLIRGVDGNWVDPSKLFVPPDCFAAVDLSKPFDLKDRYDLAVCLEVAQYLRPRLGTELIVTLTKLAPLILFSSAVPGQGGIHHVNEQWPGYWRGIFAEQGFKMLDLIRPLIREDHRIDWWYRQNIAIFANESAISSNSALRGTSDDNSNDDKGLEWVHVNTLFPPHAGIRHLLTGVRNVVTEVRPVLGKAIRKRLPAKSDATSTSVPRPS